jgi:hypothetical protein
VTPRERRKHLRRERAALDRGLRNEVGLGREWVLRSVELTRRDQQLRLGANQGRRGFWWR